MIDIFPQVIDKSLCFFKDRLISAIVRAFRNIVIQLADFFPLKTVQQPQARFNFLPVPLYLGPERIIRARSDTDHFFVNIRIFPYKGQQHIEEGSNVSAQSTLLILQGLSPLMLPFKPPGDNAAHKAEDSTDSYWQKIG